MYLWWSEPYDDVGVTRYVVYRSTDPATNGDSLAGTADTSYLDVGAAGTVGTDYFYVVKAVDATNKESMPSNKVGEFDRATINGTK
jgi:fibronectin type 3 domain-containing protein